LKIRLPKAALLKACCAKVGEAKLGEFSRTTHEPDIPKACLVGLHSGESAFEKLDSMKTRLRKLGQGQFALLKADVGDQQPVALKPLQPSLPKKRILKIQVGAANILKRTLGKQRKSHFLIETVAGKRVETILLDSFGRTDSGSSCPCTTGRRTFAHFGLKRPERPDPSL